MVESAVSDLARRGDVDGRALRLPGIVARPREPNGLRSAFMSDLMRAFAEGVPYQCPVSPEATAWWMSARCCVNNLIHAAELDGASLGAQRVWQLPVLHLSIAQVVDALAERYGQDRRTLLSYAPDAGLQALFAQMPPLKTPQARAAGFNHDRNAAALVRNSLQPLGPPTLAADRRDLTCHCQPSLNVVSSTSRSPSTTTPTPIRRRCCQRSITWITSKAGREMAAMFPGLQLEQMPGNESWAAERLHITTHSGTHMDAPGITPRPPTVVQPAFGIDELPLDWRLQPGVKLDLRHMADGHVVTADEIEAELTRIGHELSRWTIASDQHPRWCVVRATGLPGCRRRHRS